MTSRPLNIMALSFFPAFSPPRSGGEERLYNLYRELSKRASVTLISSGHFGADTECVVHNPRFIEYRVGKDNSYLKADRAISELHHGTGDRSSIAFGLSGFSPTEFHEVYCSNYANSDVIIHESPFSAFHDIFLGTDNKPRIYNSYNAEYILMNGIYTGDNNKQIREFVRISEEYIAACADLVTYCSEQDKKHLEELIGRPLANSALVPNGTYISATPNRMKREKLSLLFMGSGHEPNREAAKFIIDILAPRLPHVSINIIGSCCEPGRPAPNVLAHGIVDEQTKRHLLATSTLALNPMISGSGSNLKVMEYMACGIPVLSTAFGMRGTFARQGIHYLESEANEGFVDTIDVALKNEALRNTISQAAGQLVSSELTWPTIAARFANQIESTVRSRTEASAPYYLCLNDYDMAGIGGGGNTRMSGLQGGLAQHANVVCLCLWDEDYIGRVERAPNITIIRIPKTLEHKEKQAFFNSHFHISAADIVSHMCVADNKLIVQIYEVLSRNAINVVLEHPYMAPLVKQCAGKFVYSSHNDELSLKTLLLEWHPLREVLLEEVQKAENYCLQHSDLTVTVSDEDATLFANRQGTRGAPLLTVRNGANLPTSPSEEEQEKAAIVRAKSVVFLGSSHFPNVEAMVFIRDHIAPHVPHIDFHIVGSVGNAIGDAHPANIYAWGEVASGLKTAIMDRCNLAINPVNSGGGSNIKLADYFAHGLTTLSTSYGIRGYPPAIRPYVLVAEPSEFAAEIRNFFDDKISSRDDSSRIKTIFGEHLSMKSLGEKFGQIVSSLNAPRKKILFVTYRYIDPPIGGGELMMLQLIKRLAEAGLFSINVAFTDVGRIHEDRRFRSHFESANNLALPTNLPNVTWRKFGVEPAELHTSDEALSLTWRLQCEYETRLADMYVEVLGSGTCLLSGWHSVERSNNDTMRWTTNNSSILLKKDGTLTLSGWAPAKKFVQIVHLARTETFEVDGFFDVEIQAAAGRVSIITEAAQRGGSDLRVLGILMRSIKADGDELIDTQTISERALACSYEDQAERHDKAARNTRWPYNVRLSDQRGPFSPELEQWLDTETAKYDLVITHNCALRPAHIALQMAKRNGVPSIYIPHVHLDDDFYHFPDIAETFEQADLTLASPIAALKFLEARFQGAFRYFGAGVDFQEFAADPDGDLNAFATVLNSTEPFVLVLGRKARAKNYRIVIEAAEILRSQGKGAKLVMIGPDDDGDPVPANVTYLGTQPRSVVRGALRAASALVNMSTSESFGIVILEAWLAGTPVIANANCPAFRDLIRDKINGRLVADSREIANAIEAIVSDPELGKKLAEAGKQVASQYTWDSLAKQLEEYCLSLVNR